jgi:dihydrofolate reductase
MARIRHYVAMSVDGFVATEDGRVDWLEPFHHLDLGYLAFAEQVGTLVMGRATYDQLLGFGAWPYRGKNVVVLTSKPLGAEGPEGVEAYRGDPADLVPHLREAVDGDVWVVGGPRTARAFFDRDAVDEIELFVIPVVLGRGLSLFGGIATLRRLSLQSVEMHDGGVARLVYRRP